MTSEQFKTWRAGLGLTVAQAAAALAVPPGAIEEYERGADGDGKPVAIPKSVELACAALGVGMPAHDAGR
ncbi:MAG: XRE family transcriptional regulator [Xanthobacteraceae bacterium]